MNNDRRNFLKMTKAAAIPVGAALVTSGIARGDDGSVKEFLGSWNVKHSGPTPEGYFREFWSFADGGVVHETNTFLNNVRGLDFSPFGLPEMVSASDGFGNWERISKGRIKVAFRKMLFNTAGVNFADLRAAGTVTSDGTRLYGNDWTVDIVAPFTNTVIQALAAGAVTEGFRID